MKKQFLLCSLLIIFNNVYSQNSKTGVIYYNHIDNHYGESYNSYLVFNQSASYFVTAKDSLGLSNGVVVTDDNGGDLLVEVVDFDEVKKTRAEGLQVFVDKLVDSIYFVNAFTLSSEMIYSKEKTPKISWVFQKEIKKIGTFNCKKAIADFRGRKYSCWYTEGIPLPYGPWKLQGLPGLILEAKSEDGFFEIRFKKIKYPEDVVRVPSSKNQLLKKGTSFISLRDYKLKQQQSIKASDNSLKIQAKRFHILMDPFSEKDNFLEVFGF